jgi:ATP-binding cassette subfamily F protein uup
MNILTIENLTKSYGEKILFSNINFSVNDDDKIGIIGINGTGKSSLLKIIYGLDTADSGIINMKSDMQIEFLAQNPSFDPDATVLEQIFKGDSKVMNLLNRYENTLEQLSDNPDDLNLQKALTVLNEEMTAKDAWEIESRGKIILTKLGITRFNAKMNTLSGGQQKRVALASALISPCDLLILDEPTNHMDNSTIDWLEDYLKTRKGALLMITHDRYFLDRVVNKTLELDNGNMYTYSGNYSYFIEKKIERRAVQNMIEQKRQNLYKKELQWIRAGVQARSTKQKARIKRFETLKNTANDLQNDDIDISLGQSRLGKKVINIENISKKFDDINVIDNFSYILLRNDRIGIIGNNGFGKSTLLNIINGILTPDSGKIDVGSTVKIGYFTQDTVYLDGNKRAIEYIKEYAEFIETSDGSKISASQMMERFLFTSDMQWTYISKLSGGERRRLFLLKILMEAPNVLLLDEPTNDLDIDTLKVLENYIDDFSGAVISISHDRYFLDRTCKRIFSYDRNGNILNYTGNYTDFIDSRAFLDLNAQENEPKTLNVAQRPKKQSKLKFTYKENFEFNSIESEINALEEKLEQIDLEMTTHSHDFVKLHDLMKDKEEIEEDLLFKMERFEYLYELNEKISTQKNI